MMDDLVELQSNSSKDDDEDDNENDNIVIGSGNLYGAIHGIKEGKLKTIPQDVTYASHFAGKSSTEVYDRICSVKHFGHIANRILRKLIASENLAVSCGTTLGKNRKVRAEQRQHFENLSEIGLQILHNIIKQELEAEAVTESPVVLPPQVQHQIQLQQQQLQDQLTLKNVPSKRSINATMSNTSHNLLSSTSSSSSGTNGSQQKRPNVDALSKADLVEVIEAAFKGSRHEELQRLAIQKETAERAHFLALQKQTTLAHKQTSIKFLQEQLRDSKLTASKKKEFETKLDELMAHICAEM